MPRDLLLAQVDLPFDPNAYLGPFALTVGAITVVIVLWRIVREYINSLIARAEKAELRAEASDARLDRIATAFLKATGNTAPE